MPDDERMARAIDGKEALASLPSLTISCRLVFTTIEVRMLHHMPALGAAFSCSPHLEAGRHLTCMTHPHEDSKR